MSLRIRHVLASCGLGLIMLLAYGVDLRSQSSEPVRPSLESLKSIEYTKQSEAGQTEAVGYSELLNIILACRAYSKGLDILPRFHEPILTRGETGIAVFRKVSPSVVLVVMANFKDDKVSDMGLGTGVILYPSGTVLTNWHVIQWIRIRCHLSQARFGDRASQEQRLWNESHCGGQAGRFGVAEDCEAPNHLGSRKAW